MNSIIIIIGFVLGIFLLTPISATTFSVDKSTYENGDIIVLSGFVAPVEAGQFVSVQILNPSQSDLVQIDTFTPNSDGSFSRNYKAEGPRWNMDGFYILKIFYNGESFQTTFEFNMNPPSQPEPEPEPEPELKLGQMGTTSELESEPETKSEPISSIVKQESKTHIPSFPALEKAPQYYFDRYNNELNYKDWFDSQFPNKSIQNVVGYTKTHLEWFPDNSKSPQYYVNRYNDEPNYKDWFDSQFPNKSIYQVLGFPDPISIPNWIKNNAQWWSSGKISDEEFVSGIQFMIENNIITIPNLPESQVYEEKIVPNWVRNNANWWALDKISEDEFVNAIKYLVKQGIILV